MASKYCIFPFLFFRRRADTCICLPLVAAVPIGQMDAKPPCFVNNSDLPVTTSTLHESLKSFQLVLSQLEINSKTLQLRMKEIYCIYGTDHQKESASFMSLSKSQITASNYNCFINAAFAKEIRSHYDMLNELAYFFEQTTVNNSSNEFLSSQGLKSTKDLQADIYRCMCILQIALRMINQDPETEVPSGNLSDNFVDYRKGDTTCKQQTLEYIIVSDSKRIASYLKSIYSQIPVCQ